MLISNTIQTQNIIVKTRDARVLDMISSILSDGKVQDIQEKIVDDNGSSNWCW
jgi:hypothetical protein